ncbi:MAG: bifunctional homocysteine S-methyltransferase/methylenetetrahydrofolate reductase [Bacteroidota bacterium]|nr:bifunctional homocysteine S-methyltransferase/methylenetetrahydrofolate reductase [Bacteroidota bacterium]
MKIPFRDRLKLGPILCDGAMGTLLDLYEYDELPHEIQNIKNPDIVERLHREYIEAGSEIIETNTFSANRFRLVDYHLEDKIREINLAGVEIARRAAGDNIYVAGAVGPTGKLMEPIGKVKRQHVRDAFKEQVEYLLEGGIDLIMLETFVSTQELDEAIEAVKSLTNIPLIAQKAFAEDGSILAGNYPIEVIEHIIEKGVDIVGANCTVGPQRMFGIIRNLHKEGIYLVAQPAAGIPTLQDGRSIYHTSPEYLATYARELVQSGVTIIGACCGSTPAHIRAIRDAIKDVQIKRGDIKSSAKVELSLEPEKELQYDADKFRKSKFARNIGKKVLTTVELDIPRGVDMRKVIEGAQKCYELGVDAVNITDGARARLRMTPVAISQLIKQKVGIETITHFTARDKNLLALQADLLGSHALGIKNLLCITGDPANIGDYPQARSVFDVDSIGLIRAVSSMNRGVDLLGHTIGEPTSFLIACAANPLAADMDLEIERLEKKAEAGAELIFTQPLYELKTLEDFVKRIEHLHLPLMVGVLPLRSYKHTDFLHNEVPGMIIPEKVREKIRNAGSDASKVGIELSKEFIKEAKQIVQGIYMMPPFGKYDVVRELMEEVNR